MNHNEEELQWEGSLTVQGQDAKLKICDEYAESEIKELVKKIESNVNEHWSEIISSITVIFLNKVNERRSLLSQERLVEGNYESCLQLKSINVMEDNISELVFNDQGLSGNKLIRVCLGGDGIVRAPEIDAWEEERQIRGERVNVSVSNCYKLEEYETVIREVEATINELWHKVESVLIQYLLKHYNNNWRQEGQPELERPEFIARIELNGIHIMEDQAFDLYFLDNNLFQGHFIELFVDSDGTIFEPSLYA